MGWITRHDQGDMDDDWFGDVGPQNAVSTPSGDIYRSPENPSIWLTRTKSDDPAQALLKNPNIRSTPNKDIYKSSCYICIDPEFAQMGMPLCYPCSECGGHVAADDTVCDDCGTDAYDLSMKEREDDEHSI